MLDSFRTDTTTKTSVAAGENRIKLLYLEATPTDNDLKKKKFKIKDYRDKRFETYEACFCTISQVHSHPSFNEVRKLINPKCWL